jgi:hypothetical protein
MQAVSGFAGRSSDAASASMSARVTPSPFRILPFTLRATMPLEMLVPFIATVLPLKKPLASTPV